jgi:hypothetical protein
MRSCELFALAVLESMTLLISASQVAGITDMSHWLLAFFLFFLVALGFEFRASLLLGRLSYCYRHSTIPFYVMDFFEIGSHELFAWGASNIDPPGLCLLSS